MYYRPTPESNQYAHPLDFSPVVDTRAGKVIGIDYRTAHTDSKYDRAPIPEAEHNYMPSFKHEWGGYRNDVKPINVSQPEGVSFKMNGNELSWLGWKLHVGFNYREGVVLSQVRCDDNGTERPIFNRMSLCEMIVPYGDPNYPSTRKMALDIGEYGLGAMANSLQLGCDCKGSIHYIDGILNTHDGNPEIIKNAICIHEEDDGLLFKHTDFRDGVSVAVRARKLIINQVYTVANYEYVCNWVLKQDGTIECSLRLTGMLNTFVIAPDEQGAPWGTEVASQITAQNHQHIFSLRLDPMIDGVKNSVVQCDAVASDAPLGSTQNPMGNAFYSKRTPFKTTTDAQSDYDAATGRTWDIVSTDKTHPYAKKPTGYKIVNREAIQLLAKKGSNIAKRGPFALHNIWVVPYQDGQIYPAGKHVPQTTGEYHAMNDNILDWVKGGKNVQDTDIVVYVTFGLTHFPRTEDFPIMPCEESKVVLRPTNFFLQNPAMNVPPTTILKDKTSKCAFEESKFRL